MNAIRELILGRQFSQGRSKPAREARVRKAVASSCRLLSPEGFNSYEIDYICPILPVDDVVPTH